MPASAEGPRSFTRVLQMLTRETVSRLLEQMNGVAFREDACSEGEDRAVGLVRDRDVVWKVLHASVA